MKLFRIVCLIAMCSGSVFADIMSVQPSATTLTLGSPLTLDVNITGVTDLYAFQFDIGFNPAVLSAASVAEGSLFSSIGVFFSPGFIDNTAGTISFIGDSLSGFGPGVSTDGMLATITFNTIGVGSSSIDLANIILLDSSFADIAATASGTTVTVASSAVPEPSSWLLLGSCLVLLFGWTVNRGRFGGGTRAPSVD
jgi:general secretion pathway protein D